MPVVAFVVFPMDPTNVLRHCHNNGWLSLLHNKPICHFWQHPGVKKGAGNPRGMAMVYCDWRLWMPFVAFVVFPMGPSSVTWLYLTQTLGDYQQKCSSLYL